MKMDSFDMALLTSSLVPGTSVMVQTSPSRSVLSATDTLQAIHRQTVHLQQEIQTLLDAQSAGLMAGLGQDTSSDEEQAFFAKTPGPIHLTTSSTQGITTLNSTNTRRAPRRPSLSTTRKLLHSSMSRLADLKAGEAQALETQHDVLKTFADNMDSLISKKDRIQTSICEINESTSGNDDSLVDEEATLTVEIHTLEVRLAEARSRLVHVQNEQREGSNRKGAQLSSWMGALNDIEHKIKQEILDGVELVALFPDTGLRKGENNKRVFSPRNKHEKSVPVAEHIEQRMKMLEKQKYAAKEESIACKDGAMIWTAAVKEVENIEQTLANELVLHNLSASTTSLNNSADSSVIKVLRTMDEVLQYLDARLEDVEQKDWNLLVCAIGAEVEALRQARELLQETLSSTQNDSTPGTASMMTAKSRFASDLTDPAEQATAAAAEAGPPPTIDHTGSSNNSPIPHSPIPFIEYLEQQANQDGNTSHHKQQQLQQQEEPPPEEQSPKNFPRRYRDHDSSDDEPGPEFLRSLHI